NDVLCDDHIKRVVREGEMLGIHDRETLNITQIECGYALLSLQQHRFGNVNATNAIGAGIVRQRYAGADTDLKNATPNPFSGFDRYLATAFKHRSEHQIINRRPSRIGSCNGFFVEFAVHHWVPSCTPAPTPLLR